MRHAFDRLILALPVLFLKQYPYAWIALVALWPVSRQMAALFFLVLVAGFLLLQWQAAAWVSQMRDELAGRDGKFHVDRPPVHWHRAARNIAILTGWSLVGAALLRNQFGLSFWQILIMLVGFTVFYQDSRFFGASVIYIVTARGIAIRFVPGMIDYRLFLPYREISRIEKCDYRRDRNWDLFARSRDTREGLLMIPKSPNGFTRRIEKLFIAPRDRDRFLAELPHGFS